MKELENFKKFDIQVLEGAEYLDDTSLAEIKGGVECTCLNGKKEEICTCHNATYVLPCSCKAGSYTTICTCNGGNLTLNPVEPAGPAVIGLIQFE